LLTSDRKRRGVIPLENKDVQAQAGSARIGRRTFLSASAVTAVAAPLITSTALADAASAAIPPIPDPGLAALLRQVDPNRIKGTILRLVQFGVRAVDTVGHRSPVAFPQVVN
jgi:hypothetical protein